MEQMLLFNPEDFLAELSDEEIMDRVKNLKGPYFKRQQSSDCGHYFPDVIRIGDKKVGETYRRILNCRYCGNYEVEGIGESKILNPDEIKSARAKEFRRILFS